MCLLKTNDGVVSTQSSILYVKETLNCWTSIADCVHNQQQQFPDAPDFNNCNLEKTLPGFQQVVKCGTRKENILDKCYINLPNAYQSRSKPPISNSDHNVVHLIPTYTSKLKSSKPENKIV